MTIRVANEKTTVGAPAKIAEANPSIGLTNAEAERRRQTFGPNAIPDVSAHALGRAIEKFWSPVPWMLEGAIALELVMGKYVEAMVIGLLLVFNAALSYFQEGRAQATLAALKSRLAITASVRRDGIWKLVPAAELVPGDAVKLRWASWFLRTRKFNPAKFCSTNPCSLGSQRPSRRVTAPRPMRGP